MSTDIDYNYCLCYTMVDDKHFSNNKLRIFKRQYCYLLRLRCLTIEPLSSAEFAKSNSDSHIVKCRGLPWSAKSEDLAVFFSGCDIKGGKSVGVHFLKNDEGRQC